MLRQMIWVCIIRISNCRRLIAFKRPLYHDMIRIIRCFKRNHFRHALFKRMLHIICYAFNLDTRVRLPLGAISRRTIAADCHPRVGRRRSNAGFLHSIASLR